MGGENPDWGRGPWKQGARLQAEAGLHPCLWLLPLTPGSTGRGLCPVDSWRWSRATFEAGVGPRCCQGCRKAYASVPGKGQAESGWAGGRDEYGGCCDLGRKPPRAPQLEETPETPPSSRAEGLLFRDWFPCAGAVLSLVQSHRGRPQTTSTRLYAGGDKALDMTERLTLSLHNYRGGHQQYLAEQERCS